MFIVLFMLTDNCTACLCQVPIFMISTVAEEMLAFTNAVPEWLCKQRQQKVYFSMLVMIHAM